MSVQVLKVSFPVLSIAVLVERSRRREYRPAAGAPVEVRPGRPSQRSPLTTGVEPSLIKLQM